MTLSLESFASYKFFSRSAISKCLYLSLLALHNLIPSIIEAWFNSSLIIASSGVSTASKKPAFASKQDGNRMAASNL